MNSRFVAEKVGMMRRIESLVESEVVLSVLVLVFFEGPALVLDVSSLCFW